MLLERNTCWCARHMSITLCHALPLNTTYSLQLNIKFRFYFKSFVAICYTHWVLVRASELRGSAQTKSHFFPIWSFVLFAVCILDIVLPAAGCQTLAAQQDTQANCSGRIRGRIRISRTETEPKAKEGPKCAQDLWPTVLLLRLGAHYRAIKYNQIDCLFCGCQEFQGGWPIMRFWFFINFFACN